MIDTLSVYKLGKNSSLMNYYDFTKRSESICKKSVTNDRKFHFQQRQVCGDQI